MYGLQRSVVFGRLWHEGTLTVVLQARIFDVIALGDHHGDEHRYRDGWAENCQLVRYFDISELIPAVRISESNFDFHHEKAFRGRGLFPFGGLLRPF